MTPVKLSDADIIVNIYHAEETYTVTEVKPGIEGDEENKLIACINDKGQPTNGYLDEKFLESRGYRGFKK